MEDERRSTRKRPAINALAESDSGFEEPPTKRTKKTTKAVSRKCKGKSPIGDLQAFPVELVIEILSYLKPQHFVRLMYLCRTFYDVLSGDSEYVSKLWKNAREREVIPIPDPPKDMRESQWATFLYATDCQSCGTSLLGKTREIILFSLRRRICKSCLSHNLIRGADRPVVFINKFPYAHIASLRHLIPSDKSFSGDCIYKTGSWIHGPEYFWIPDISRICRYLAAEFPEVFFSEIEPSESEAFMTWSAERETQREETINHAVKCCEWEKQMRKQSGGKSFKKP